MLNVFWFRKVSSKVRICIDYPEPIIEHSEAKKLAVSKFNQI
jgi:hypothetical protein